MKTILTVAGWDPCSGAGVTKDLDTFLSLGLHGLSVITCSVVQGPRGVRAVFPADEGVFSESLSAIAEEVTVDGIKVGVLWGKPYAEGLSRFLASLPSLPVVIDPVLAAKNGIRLLTDEGVQTILSLLFPLAAIVTPNAEEASILAGMPVGDIGAMKTAAQKILSTGAGAVVIKGGHLPGDPVDLFFDGKEYATWRRHRIGRETHGTGCTFSSLIASFLVLGHSPREAFLAAEERMEEALQEGYRISTAGYYFPSSSLRSAVLASRFRVVEALREAAGRMAALNPVTLVPAVQMNVGFAVEQARGVEDVAAFPGRIGVFDGRILMKAEPAFGASSHVARLILAAMSRFPEVRAAANLRCDPGIIARARERGLDVLYFDRKAEPRELKEEEGRSLSFLMANGLRDRHSPPDIIYDDGDVGKEPMIRLFARNPRELIDKMEMMER